MHIELKILLTPEEYELLKDAADAAGNHPSDFIPKLMRGIDEIVITEEANYPRMTKTLPFLSKLYSTTNPS